MYMTAARSMRSKFVLPIHGMCVQYSPPTPPPPPLPQYCQQCRGGGNESLLWCDGCDKGTHTYCCRRKLEGIPECDWYCSVCQLGSAKFKPCQVCDSSRGVLLSCEKCSKSFHIRCLNPPLNRFRTYIHTHTHTHNTHTHTQ